MAVTHSITDGIVYPIGKPADVDTTYANKDNVYDVAVGGQPFFLAASDKYPYHRETAPFRKQQIDLTQQPGEQTFEGWWLRSQGSWHLGAGIKFLEPLQGDNVIYRFDKSNGVDVWTPGQATLLSDTTNVKTVTSNVDMFGAIDGSNNSCVFLSNNANLYRLNTAGTSTAVTYGGSGSDISSICQDGVNYYAANATGIYQGTLTGGSGTKIWNTGSSKVVINWVKQRLFAGIGTGLYELVGSGPTLPTVTYNHPNSSWTWTGIAEGPNAIYASGYSGTSSSIYKIGLSGTGTIPALTSAVTAADFPDDEHVTSIGVYLGKYMLIGTNKGIRVGIIDSNGFISYGGLTYQQSGTDHISGFAFRDRFAYATVTNDIDGKSGLIRIDLSAEVENGRYAWANDLSAGVVGACRNVAFIGETELLAFTVEGQGLFYQHATRKVASGYLQTGAMRYNTMEKKHFKFIKVRVKEPMQGNVAISTVDKSGTVTSILTIGDATAADSDYTTGLNAPAEQLAFRFTLYRNDSVDSTGAGIIGYQVKALPANRRNRNISIPLLCFDFESDRYNITTGYEGRAWERISALEALESTGDTLLFQDFTSNEQVMCVIEKVTFDRMSPPERRYQGFGGVVYVTVRTV